MGLMSLFRRNADSVAVAATTNDLGDGIAEARTRARRRLIGAVVLVVIGIVGFPLVFETRPRPISIDIPIEIPNKDGAPALVMPPARAAVESPAPASAAVPPPLVPGERVTVESRADAGREVWTPPSPVLPAASAVERAAPKPTVRPAAPAAADPGPKPTEPPSKPAAAGRAVDAARATALLEGRGTSTGDPTSADAAPAEAGKPAASRFIVQVGAFAEAATAREARLKAEKLGLKTYTQVADTPAGSRIRVRVGPFASRDDADRALLKARAAGLGGVVLAL